MSDAKTLAKPAIEAVKSKEIQFVPANWEKNLFSMDGPYSRLVHKSSTLVGT